jgi:ribosome-binding protein aMBF1 (putative translation factor)
MKCERCGNDKEAEFRVVSDILNIKVCADCAGQARKIGLSLEIVAMDEANSDRATSKDGRQRRGTRIDSTGSKHRHQTERRVA